MSRLTCSLLAPCSLYLATAVSSRAEASSLANGNWWEGLLKPGSRTFCQSTLGSIQRAASCSQSVAHFFGASGVGFLVAGWLGPSPPSSGKSKASPCDPEPAAPFDPEPPDAFPFLLPLPATGRAKSMSGLGEARFLVDLVVAGGALGAGGGMIAFPFPFATSSALAAASFPAGFPATGALASALAFFFGGVGSLSSSSLSLLLLLLLSSLPRSLLLLLLSSLCSNSWPSRKRSRSLFSSSERSSLACAISSSSPPFLAFSTSSSASVMRMTRIASSSVKRLLYFWGSASWVASARVVGWSMSAMFSLRTLHRRCKVSLSQRDALALAVFSRISSRRP